MKKPSLTALAAVLALSSPAMAEKLTPERVFADPGLSGPTAKGVALSPDGKRPRRPTCRTSGRPM